MSPENSSNPETAATEQEVAQQLAERFDRFLADYTPFIYPFVSPAIIKPRHWGMFVSRLYRIDPVMRTRPLPHLYSPTVKRGERIGKRIREFATEKNIPVIECDPVIVQDIFDNLRAYKAVPDKHFAAIASACRGVLQDRGLAFDYVKNEFVKQTPLY